MAKQTTGKKYAIVFMDAVHFHVRQDNQTIKKAVYVDIGIRLTGQKEVLGMCIGGNESAKYWLGVLNEIKNRGVEDIMIVSVDALQDLLMLLDLYSLKQRYCNCQLKIRSSAHRILGHFILTVVPPTIEAPFCVTPIENQVSCSFH